MKTELNIMGCAKAFAVKPPMDSLPAAEGSEPEPNGWVIMSDPDIIPICCETIRKAWFMKSIIMIDPFDAVVWVGGAAFGSDPFFCESTLRAGIDCKWLV